VVKSEDHDRVALTFDGGASSVPTPAILKALRDAGVHATMFMTADFVQKNPELVVQMAKDGHEFGNHSSTHPDMTTISSQEMVAELDRLEATVVALTGKSTRPWFRPPYGAYNDRVLAVAGGQGYDSIMWTADSADWRDDIDAATVEARLLRYAAPGAILIEHMGSPQSAQVLPEVLSVLKKRGLSFGTLSEVLGTP
jgi:peptidoglycan/xylan/chitin deacetylase (PgdA/CDA1 family)